MEIHHGPGGVLGGRAEASRWRGRRLVHHRHGSVLPAHVCVRRLTRLWSWHTSAGVALVLPLYVGRRQPLRLMVGLVDVDAVRMQELGGRVRLVLQL